MFHFTFQNMRTFYGPWPRGLGLSLFTSEIDILSVQFSSFDPELFSYSERNLQHTVEFRNLSTEKSFVRLTSGKKRHVRSFIHTHIHMNIWSRKMMWSLICQFFQYGYRYWISHLFNVCATYFSVNVTPYFFIELKPW